MSIQSSILVGCADKEVWIKVEGKGSFQNSPGLKEFAKEMINRGHRAFTVDLRACPVMDSTFMGTLAGIALRLREIGQGAMHVVNLNERNHELLCNLGLDQLFSVEASKSEAQLATKGADPAKQALERGDAQPQDRLTQVQTMLEAHEALVAADAQNLTKFKDVLDYLRQDLNLPE